jgi:hypothetical protein
MQMACLSLNFTIANGVHRKRGAKFTAEISRHLFQHTLHLTSLVHNEQKALTEDYSMDTGAFPDKAEPVAQVVRVCNGSLFDVKSKHSRLYPMSEYHSLFF